MLEIPQHGSGSPPYEVHGAGPRRAAQETYSRIIGWIEKYLLLLVLGGLIAGIGVASVSQPVVDRVDSAINVFMNLYDLVAPAAIFLILTPALARVFSTRTMGRFGVFVIRWYAVRKVLACLWAILFILIVFRIPFLPQGSLSLSDGILQTLQSLGRMAATSTYFWAMYAAIGLSLVSIRVRVVTRALEKMMDGVELAGSYLMPIIPLFMFDSFVERPVRDGPWSARVSGREAPRAVGC